MGADMKQQKVHNQETFQAFLLVYNRPSLIRNQVGSDSTFGCMAQFYFYFISFLNTHN